ARDLLSPVVVAAGVAHQHGEERRLADLPDVKQTHGESHEKDGGRRPAEPTVGPNEEGWPGLGTRDARDASWLVFHRAGGVGRIVAVGPRRLRPCCRGMSGPLQRAMLP